MRRAGLHPVAEALEAERHLLSLGLPSKPDATVTGSYRHRDTLEQPAA